MHGAKHLHAAQQQQPFLLLQVHFDCIYKGIDVVSSRQARLLGGNRTISEVRLGIQIACTLNAEDRGN